MRSFEFLKKSSENFKIKKNTKNSFGDSKTRMVILFHEIRLKNIDGRLFGKTRKNFFR